MKSLIGQKCKFYIENWAEIYRMNIQVNWMDLGDINFQGVETQKIKI